MQEKVTYEEELSLLVLYEILDAIYKPSQKQYPKEIVEKINDLLVTLNKYLYHEKKGYDILKEKYLCEITYQKKDD